MKRRPFLRIVKRLCLSFVALLSLEAMAFASPPSSASLEIASRAVLNALKNKDGKALAGLIDPARGLRFIPYPWDYLPETVVLGPKEVESLFRSRSKGIWGKFDASGDPIKMKGAEYVRRFVWNVDYTKVRERDFMPLEEHLKKIYAYRGANEDVLEIFPNAWTASYFFPGISGPEGGAMDWSWLTLIFVPKGEGWGLVGLVHKEWTI